ncbi:MAG: hypothetical protein AAFX46_11135 [Cyanobacteria bacterium J06636_27]
MSQYTSHNNQDFSVNIGQYFSRGWEIFKQYPLGFIGYLITVFLISIFLTFLPILIEQLQGIATIASWANVVLNPIFYAGFDIVALQIAKNRPIDFSDFFRGFNQFLQIFLVHLISNILIVIGCWLLIIPGIYLAVAYQFSSLFVIEKKLSFWSALEASRKLITKQWFSFLLFGIALFLLNVAGVLALGIGMFVTFPLTLCIVVAAFEDIVGLNKG